LRINLNLVKSYISEFLILFIKMSRKKKKNRVVKQWKDHWADYLIQFMFLGLFLWIFTTILSDSLKPQTDIEVYSPNISKLYNVSEDYRIELVFNNKADFAGEEFYLYVWGLTSGGWGSDYPASEHCKRIEELEVDYQHRFKIYCDFIPPKSKFGFHIDFELDNRANKSGFISVEYWGKTTPYDRIYYNLSSFDL